MQRFRTNPLNKISNSTQYSIYPSRGGFVTIGTETPELFCQLAVESGGSVIVENKDGTVRYYPQLNPGAIYPIMGTKILASATIDGQAVTTSASNIWWYGGI